MPMLWLIPASMTSRMRRYSRQMEIFFSSVFSSKSLTEINDQRHLTMVSIDFDFQVNLTCAYGLAVAPSWWWGATSGSAPAWANLYETCKAIYDYETCKATHTNSLRKSASHIVDKKVAKHVLSLVFSSNMTFYSAVCDDYLIIKFGK